jgi:sugar phosphate isomerase/epimerase
MRLGISSPLAHDNAEEWARHMKEAGCGCVNFPIDYTQPDSKIADYADAAEKYGLVIAEVGIWRNVFAIDTAEREEARKRAVGQFRMADEIGARCCVNIAGTYGGAQWDGGYKDNYSVQCRNVTIRYIQDLIDTVKPTRTHYSVEPMPWMLPDGPDECLQLLHDVDREAMAIHLDVVNMINCPKRYFFSDDFLDECFDKLGEFIESCHLKDIRLRPELTFQLEETICGNGTLNIEKYMRLIDQYDQNMPVIIEHLTTDQEYRDSLAYVRERLIRADIPITTGTES